MESTTTRYSPREGDQPCVQCSRPVHPADANQTRLRHGTTATLCCGCLRMLEQQLREPRHGSHLDAVQAQVDADPDLARPSVADAHRSGLRVNN